MTIENAMRVYDAIDDKGRKKLFECLDATDAKSLAISVSTRHRIAREARGNPAPCACFACCYPTA